TMFPFDDEGYFCADEECHYVETWEAMEALADEGLCRAIGLSNFNRRQVQEILDLPGRRHPVAVLQCECHAYLQQKDLVDFCGAHGVAFQCYSPLGSGTTHLGVTKSPSGTLPLQDPLVLRLADKYAKDPAQILLKFQLQRGRCLVTKSVSPARIASNFQLFDWALEPADLDAFDAINYGWRHLQWRETSNHPDYPFPDELPHDYKLEKAPTVSSSGQQK
ncbi:MAG: aldo/keto reductase, partial [Planctomycetota bacterium]